MDITTTQLVRGVKVPHASMTIVFADLDPTIPEMPVDRARAVAVELLGEQKVAGCSSRIDEDRFLVLERLQAAEGGAAHS